MLSTSSNISCEEAQKIQEEFVDFVKDVKGINIECCLLVGIKLKGIATNKSEYFDEDLTRL